MARLDGVEKQLPVENWNEIIGDSTSPHNVTSRAEADAKLRLSVRLLQMSPPPT